MCPPSGALVLSARVSSLRALLGLRVPSVWVSKAQGYLRDGPWSPEKWYSEGERLCLNQCWAHWTTLHLYLTSSFFLPTEEVGAAGPQPLSHPLSGGCCSGSLPTSPGHCVSTLCVSSESPGHCQRQFWACVEAIPACGKSTLESKPGCLGPALWASIFWLFVLI